jgi:intermediate peptidase
LLPFFQSLKAALDDPAVHSSLSEEELRNAHVFIHDFSKSGITLPSASARQSFVDLSDQILHLSRQFASSLTSPPTGSIRFPDASVLLPGLGESFVRRVKSRNGSATIGIGSWEAGMVLRKCANEEARRKVWVACNGGEGAQGEEKKIAVLEAMLNTRAKVAGLVGRGSWGEVELENKMAQKPGESSLFPLSISLCGLPPSADPGSFLGIVQNTS